MSASGIASINPKPKVEFVNRCAATFVGDDRVLVPIAGDVAVFKVSEDAGGLAAEELYRSNALGGSTYAPPVYHDGYIYGYRGQVL